MLVVLLPFYIAFVSGGALTVAVRVAVPRPCNARTGFWPKEAVYYEQPTVVYRHELLMVVSGVGSGNTWFSRAWTTSPVVNNALQTTLSPTVRVRECTVSPTQRVCVFDVVRSTDKLT